MKIFCKNKKAYFNYEIIEKYEAGIVLIGSEIKSLIMGKADLSGAYGKILLSRDNIKPELFLINARIGEGEQANRMRKLLMHRSEINRLIGKIKEKKLTLIALMIYGKNGKAKIELGLGRGKKQHLKKEIIKKRDIERQIAQEIQRK